MTSLPALHPTGSSHPATAPAAAAPDALPAADRIDRAATPSPTPLPNPSSRLDAELGLVVLVFRDADGTTRTIPSERELEAYRAASPERRHADAMAARAADSAAPGHEDR